MNLHLFAVINLLLILNIMPDIFDRKGKDLLYSIGYHHMILDFFIFTFQMLIFV